MCAALLLGGYHAGVLRVRVLAPLALLLAVMALWQIRREPAARGLATCGLLGAMGLGATARALDDAGFRWLPTLAALCLGLAWLASWLATPEDPAASADPAPRPRDWWAVAIIAVIGSFGGELLFSTEASRLIDETWYLVLADLLGHGRVVGSYPAGAEALFGVRHGLFADGTFVSQYPLGWPALLVWPLRWEIHRFVGPTLAVAAALLTGALVRRASDARAGVVAAMLVGTAPAFVSSSWSYLSHAASAACVAAAAWALERGSPSRQGAGLWLAIAGAAGGLLFSMRPISAAPLGVLALARVMLDGTRPLPARWPRALMLASGFAVPALLVFAGNAATTGHWRTFGYSFVNGSLHRLGFGVRGYRLFDSLGNFVTETVTFTPWQGLQYVLNGSLESLTVFLPLGVLLPLAWWQRDALRRGPAAWWIAGCMAAIAIHGLWFYRGVRFFLDVVPLMGATAAVLLLRMPLFAARWRTVTAQAAVIGLAVTAGIGWVDRPWTLDVRQTYREVAALAPAGERIGLSVAEGPDAGADFQALWVLNSPRFGGRYTVIRDTGLPADTLAARFPGIRWFRVRCAPCEAAQLPLSPIPQLTPAAVPP